MADTVALARAPNVARPVRPVGYAFAKPQHAPSVLLPAAARQRYGSRGGTPGTCPLTALVAGTSDEVIHKVLLLQKTTFVWQIDLLARDYISHSQAQGF